MPSLQDCSAANNGKADSAEGFGGLYVPSNVEGTGKIEYWQIDKTAIDVNGKVLNTSAMRMPA